MNGRCPVQVTRHGFKPLGHIGDAGGSCTGTGKAFNTASQSSTSAGNITALRACSISRLIVFFPCR
jgi:hypothetical protein